MTDVDQTDDPSGPDDGADGAGSSVLSAELRHCWIVTGVVATVAFVGLFVVGNNLLGADLSMAYPVLLVGAGAAAANNVRRVHRFQAALDRDPSMAGPSATGLSTTGPSATDRLLAVGQIYVSPAIGATFALVGYYLFMSGILQGDFFPAFACAEDTYTGYKNFADCSPSTNAEASKALIWAFVAGFSERFVPNVLDRITPGDVSAGTS